jgi:hypothetical protein
MLQEGLGHLQETLLSADERAKFDDLHASYQFTVEASRLAEAKVNTAGAVQENILRGYFQLLLPMSGVHTLRDAEATSRLVSSLVEQIQKDFCEVENLSKKLQQSNDYAQFLNKMDIRIEQRKIVALMSTLEQLTEQVNAIKDALHQHKDIKIAIQQFSILFACVRSQLGQLTVPLTVRAAVAEHLRDLSSIFEVSGFKDALNKMQDIDLSTAQRLQIADNCHQNIRLANGLLLCLCSKMSRHFEPATLVEVESRPADSDSRLAHFSTPSPISVTREASPRPASAVLPGKRSRHSSHSSPLAQFSVVAANPPLSQHSSKPPVVAKHFSTQLPPAKLAKGE